MRIYEFDPSKHNLYIAFKELHGYGRYTVVLHGIDKNCIFTNQVFIDPLYSTPRWNVENFTEDNAVSAKIALIKLLNHEAVLMESDTVPTMEETLEALKQVNHIYNED